MKIQFFPYTVPWSCQRHKVLLPILVLMSSLISCHAAAIPKSIINSSQWQAESRIFLANCSEETCFVGSIQALKPKTHWKSESQFLELAWVGPPKINCPKKEAECWGFQDRNKLRKSVIYGLAATEGSVSVLYQFDAESGEELGSFSLSVPVTHGFLLAEEVFFENAWHTLLICAGTPKDLPTQLFIWDITDPDFYFNKPIFSEILNVLTESKFKMTARPCLLRHSEGHFSLGLAGRCLETSGLYLVQLQDFSKSLFIKVSSSSLTAIQAIDSNGRGFVNKLYAVNEQGWLWSIAVEGSKVNEPMKILEGIDPHPAVFRVLKNIQQPGLDIYYLGRDPEKGLGVFKLSHRLETQEFKKTLIASGCFINLWVRFGHLILLADSPLKMPLVLSRSYHSHEQLLTIPWKIHKGVKAHSKIVQSTLLWDPEQQSETLVTLNDKGQIMILQVAITRSLYGRVAWKRSN